MHFKYFFGIGIGMKNMFQFINFFRKCKTVVKNIKSSIAKTFNEATFPNPRANCMKIKDSFGVRWFPIYICD